MTYDTSGGPKDDASLLVEKSHKISLVSQISLLVWFSTSLSSTKHSVFVTLENQVIIAGTNFVNIYTISKFGHHGTQQCISLLHRVDLPSLPSDITAPFSDRGFNWMVAKVKMNPWFYAFHRIHFPLV
jgi:hypothetical protein